MIYKCDCGATKTVQPYKSNAVKRMICDNCRNKMPRTIIRKILFAHLRPQRTKRSG